jgi:hypothetical protein
MLCRGNVKVPAFQHPGLCKNVTRLKMVEKYFKYCRLRVLANNDIFQYSNFWILEVNAR